MYMSESCTASCGTCESKRSACDRPDDTPPLVREGGVAATMQRILDDFPQYNPRALSRPGQGSKGDASPWVITLDRFVSDEEACPGSRPRSPLRPMHASTGAEPDERRERAAWLALQSGVHHETAGCERDVNGM